MERQNHYITPITIERMEIFLTDANPLAPDGTGYKVLDVKVKVNGVEHNIRQTLLDNDLVSHFERVWQMLGIEMQRQITKHMKGEDNAS